jgi:cysteinyl-tRNA synthetase
MNAAMNTEPSQQIHDLAAVRAQARADKDWAAADAARDAIVALGWIVTDTAQ